MRKTCLPKKMLNLSCVFKDTHPNFLAHKSAKTFFIKPSLQIFLFVEIFLFLFFTDLYEFVLVSTCLLYLYNPQIRLRLLVLLLLWACHCHKHCEYLAPFFALQPKLKKLSLRQELEVLFQLVPVFTWELSFLDFPFPLVLGWVFFPSMPPSVLPIPLPSIPCNF